MTATEWGTIGPAADGTAGDAVLAAGFSRTFVTTSPGGFPQVITVAAIPALINPGADPADRHARRDVLEVITTDTYLEGADLADGDPFDSECAYAWPVDYWPASARRRDGEPTMRAMTATARRHVRTLPTAWIESMPAPPASLLLNGEPFTG